MREDKNMNLHEECLLKYLLNPMDLFDSTELLILNNNLIANGTLNACISSTSLKINCEAKRI